MPQTRFAALVDDADNPAGIGKAAAASGVVIELLVDLNIGMDRSGIAPGDEAAALYRSLCAPPGRRTLAGGGQGGPDQRLSAPWLAAFSLRQ